jgi:hypothetical protein
MIARFLGVRVWELSKVAAHYQDEAAVILTGSYEAKVRKREHAVKAGAMNIEIILPEF